MYNRISIDMSYIYYMLVLQNIEGYLGILCKVEGCSSSIVCIHHLILIQLR